TREFDNLIINVSKLNPSKIFSIFKVMQIVDQTNFILLPIIDILVEEDHNHHSCTCIRVGTM
ncbi:hypothetical protein S83_050588, partial [Arachis hypogaea]